MHLNNEYILKPRNLSKVKHFRLGTNESIASKKSLINLTLSSNMTKTLASHQMK